MPQFKKQPAYSLVFAFVMMTLILILATTSITNTKGKILYFSELEAASQARLSAESAAEKAILTIKSYEAGYETEEEESLCFNFDEYDANSDEDSGTNDSIDDCQSWASFTVYAQGQENDEEESGTAYFYTPIPNTGDAAPSDECSILDAHRDVDHACNWNKLAYGESVSLPLHSVDEYGTISFPTTESGFSEFILKVRTPCEDDTYEADCNGGDRYLFAGDGTADLDGDGYTNDDDPSVILWQLIGEDDDGTVSVFPSDPTEYERTYDAEIRTSANSEIYESLLNDGYDNEDYLALETDDLKGSYDLTDSSKGLFALNLQLDVIASLIDEEGSSIPYLEWQLLTAPNEGFADTKAHIIGEGYHQVGSRTYYHPYSITRSATGVSTSIYTLSN
jgi:hypothetical protein